MKRVETFSKLYTESISEEMVYSMDAELNVGLVQLTRNPNSQSSIVNLLIRSRAGDEIVLSDITAIKGLIKVLDKVVSASK